MLTRIFLNLKLWLLINQTNLFLLRKSIWRKICHWLINVRKNKIAYFLYLMKCCYNWFYNNCKCWLYHHLFFLSYTIITIAYISTGVLVGIKCALKRLEMMIFCFKFSHFLYYFIYLFFTFLAKKLPKNTDSQAAGGQSRSGQGIALNEQTDQPKSGCCK